MAALLLERDTGATGGGGTGGGGFDISDGRTFAALVDRCGLGLMEVALEAENRDFATPEPERDCTVPTLG